MEAQGSQRSELPNVKRDRPKRRTYNLLTLLLSQFSQHVMTFSEMQPEHPFVWKDSSAFHAFRLLRFRTRRLELDSPMCCCADVGVKCSLMGREEQARGEGLR